ncbi:UbiA prenyltransferase family-domain-containing protein [Tirmania nivea]|nr:UbiA prenyltransferase family-domain-containing protein [Tirmania nivea]
MLLSRTKAGEVCLRCALRLEARRGISSVAGTAGRISLPFFDRSGGGGNNSVGSFFFGNERLFVGSEGRRWGAGRGSRWKLRGVGTMADGMAKEEAAVAAIPTTPIIDEIAQALPPHRRRQYLKKQQQQQLQEQPQNTPVHSPQDSTAIIPPDASAQLSDAAKASTTTYRRSALAYLSLTKPRLTALIALSAATSYALLPTPPLLTSPDAPSLSTLTLLYLTLGTTLCSAAANTLNMAAEPKYDAQMSRTKNRPLVRKLLTGRQAIVFAMLCAGTGTVALWFGVNPTVAGLGAANIILYAGIYTPLKRVSIVNTWVGALVGAIPPLMGWAAAATSTTPSLPSTPTTHWYDESLHLLSHPGGWLLAALLFAWQFPHFNALSTTIAQEYKAAGYQMMSWKYPALNARVALRYSILCFPICVGLWWVGVTDRGFLVTSSVVNAWLVKEAWRFWRLKGQGGTSRRLFWASVWHLPGVLGLACLHKKGLWESVGKWWWGEEEEEEEDGYVY